MIFGLKKFIEVIIVCVLVNSDEYFYAMLLLFLLYRSGKDIC